MTSQSNQDSDFPLPLGSFALQGEEPCDGSTLPEIPVLDMMSDQPLPPLEESQRPPEGRPRARETAPQPTSSPQRPAGSIWMDGNVLLCACPDCQAPMTVRIWLMVADCWQCGTSIELSEEQEREARRLLQQREMQQRGQATRRSASQRWRMPRGRGAAAAGAAAASDALDEAAPTPRPAPSRPAQAEPTPPRAPRRRAAAAQAPGAVRSRIHQLATSGPTSVWVSDLFRQTPAWLVSLVFHLVLLTLLGLLTFPEDDGSRTIRLSSAVSRDVREGGEITVDPSDDLQLDLPLPDNVDTQDPQVRRALMRADQEARKLRIDPETPHPQLPDLQRVKEQLNQPGRSSAALAARDPRIRVQIIRQEGGTTLTEAAVARGLDWLARHQQSDGRWSLHAFHREPGCTCNGGGMRSDSAATSLALLPFLGAGQTHLVGRYRDTVSQGLRWMIDQQRADGDLRAGSADNSGMYAHGQGAIVLCEAYLLTGDQDLRDPAQRAIDFIVEAQHDAGGWRYHPGQPGDTSVVGWQLMALQSARAADLTVPDFTLELARQYLDTVEFTPDFRDWQRRWLPLVSTLELNDIAEIMRRDRWGRLDAETLQKKLRRLKQTPAARQTRRLSNMIDEFERLAQMRGLYSYMQGHKPTEVMTAEALLCRMYLGWTTQDTGLTSGMDYLLQEHLPSERETNIYYWYYATQAFHHLGGPAWQQWNSAIRDILVETQRRSGHAAGSWNPSGPHARAGGRIYMTALAVCTLEVYYRHLPIFRRINLN